MADAAAVAATPAPEAGVVATKAPTRDGADQPAADAGRAAAPRRSPPSPSRPSLPRNRNRRTTPAAKAIDKQKQADKDLAREAWRRNRPDISVAGAKTSLLVPIKGSIKGADFKILDKRASVAVTLPRAVSMVTMRVYNLKHPRSRGSGSIRMRRTRSRRTERCALILAQSLDPQVEITEDFVRVTIRRPDSATRPRAQKRRTRRHAEKQTSPGARRTTAPESTSKAEQRKILPDRRAGLSCKALPYALNDVHDLTAVSSSKICPQVCALKH